MRVVGGTGPTHIKPLKEDKAVEAGAELLGELFIYTVASSFLVFEYWRSSRREAEMDAEQDKDIDVLQKEVLELQRTLTILNDRILYLEKNQKFVSTKKKS